MTQLFALAYLSEATRDLRPEELDALLLDARVFNASEQVTGALLYSGASFFQLLEGSEDAVRRTFARLSAARTHRNIRILCEGPVAVRLFGSWHMGFVQAPRTAIQTLSQSAWEDAIPYTREDVEKFEGIGLLVHYWNKWAAERVAFPP